MTTRLTGPDEGPQCGTPRGAFLHTYRRQPTCADCAAAWLTFSKTWKAPKPQTNQQARYETNRKRAKRKATR